MKTQKTTDQTFNTATQNITGRAISYSMDENDNTKFLKSGTQMEQLSYNSTATSGLHCNHIQHTTVQSVFDTPFTIWLQQGNHHQRLRSVCYTCLRKENYFRETQLCKHAYTL
jgi:hypothetical protein